MHLAVPPHTIPMSAVSHSAVSVTQVNHVPKYYLKNSRDKQFISLKLCIVLSDEILHHPAPSCLEHESSFYPQFVLAVYAPHP